MSLSHLTYVRCDRCGDPASCGDNAREARTLAINEGWHVSKASDLCPKCFGILADDISKRREGR